MTAAVPRRALMQDIGRTVALAVCSAAWVILLYWNELVGAGLFGNSAEGSGVLAPAGWGAAAYLPIAVVAARVIERWYLAIIPFIGQLATSLAVNQATGTDFSDVLPRVLIALLILEALVLVGANTRWRDEFALAQLAGALGGAMASLVLLEWPGMAVWVVLVAASAWGGSRAWFARPSRLLWSALFLVLVPTITVASSMGPLS